ncbi:hypothetical protein FGB62_55g064 [Gracilaria domingensis]|nr:hypothetical protein FGB62_55g064 [Gracilaria domingensis]
MPAVHRRRRASSDEEVTVPLTRRGARPSNACARKPQSDDLVYLHADSRPRTPGTRRLHLPHAHPCGSSAAARKRATESNSASDGARRDHGVLQVQAAVVPTVDNRSNWRGRHIDFERASTRRGFHSHAAVERRGVCMVVAFSGRIPAKRTGRGRWQLAA